MYNFENKIANGTEIYYSRFIASYLKAGGNLKRYSRTFRHWLESLGLDKEDIRNIEDMAYDGKLELQDSAEKFLKNNNSLAKV